MRAPIVALATVLLLCLFALPSHQASDSFRDFAVSCGMCGGSPLSLTSKVTDCCCSPDSLVRLNRALSPTLQALLQRAKFRYFRVNLWRGCPYWQDDGMCAMRQCALSECPQEEIDLIQDGEGLGQGVAIKGLPTSLAHDRAAPWTSMDEPHPSDEREVRYYSLLVNPERYTGYAGDSAHRIWRSIYEENCFSSEDMCLEKRIFYRLVSGMHTSISSHLSWISLLQDGSWGPNVTEYERRVTTYKDRVENLFFLNSLLLRSLAKGGEALVERARVALRTGNSTDDELALAELSSIVGLAERGSSGCHEAFDETSVFRGPDADDLKAQFRARFYNISRILDCVGCEKCRLWGKVQVTGLATALKVLLVEGGPAAVREVAMGLSRAELVAFVNFVGRVSSSVAIFDDYTKRSLDGSLSAYMNILVTAGVAVLLGGLLTRLFTSKQERKI